MASVRQLLLSGDIRLITLTGPPGVGKTRLALEIGADLAGWLRDGVAFVDLSAIRDSQLVNKAIAAAFAFWETSARPVHEQLQDHLRQRELLLILDNFEQVAEAAPQVAELLAACPGLKMLVTSRVSLHLRAEREWLVAPLRAPLIGEQVSATELKRFPAMALFANRARAVQADFTLTDQNTAAVAEICARVDGIPLAIELAAAWVKTLTPHAMLGRLKHRLLLLSRLARDGPLRHQSLRAAIGWSYVLLNHEDQTLFRRLAVFAGGYALEAAERLAADLSVDVLAGLASLVDGNLVQREVLPDSSERFRMLETVREFAFEQLALSGELDQLQDRHAAYFLQLAEQADEALTTSSDVTWLDRLSDERDNLRAAFEWLLSRPSSEMALRLAQSLWPYWTGRGYYSEGREWLERALSQSQQAAPLMRIKAVLGAGAMAFSQDDYSPAAALVEHGLELARTHGEVGWSTFALAALGHIAWHRGEPTKAQQLCSASVVSVQTVREPWIIAFALAQCAAVAWHEHDYDRAGRLAEEALKVSRDVVLRMASPSATVLLGIAAQHGNDVRRAEMLFRESLTSARRLRDPFNIAISLVHLAGLDLIRRRLDGAWVSYSEALPLLHEIGDRWFQAACLKGMAGVALARRQPAVAARMLGAAAAAEAGIGMPTHPPEPVEAAIRDALGDEPYLTAWAEGHGMSLEQAVHYALDFGAVLRDGQAKRRGQALSIREREVAALLARGFSNQQIGATLFITEKTAAHHVQHILDKLAFRSRAQVAAWAVRQGLAREDSND